MSAILDLFNGKIYPYKNLERDEEYQLAGSRLSDCLDKADEKIPKDGDFFSDKVMEQISVLENKTAEQAFAMGFSLGVRLIAECYSNN